MGGSVHTVKKNTEALVIARKETGLEVNADKKLSTWSCFEIRMQNAGRSHNMKIDSKSLERVGEFRFLDTILTSQNSIQEEMKSRLKSEYACYH